MANKTVLELLSTASHDLRTKSANFISSADVENGQLFAQGALSTDADKSEVYTITQPATATLSGLFMAYAPEDLIVELADGTKYKLDNMNPQNFTNLAGYVFSGFQPAIGDKIKITAEGFTGAIGGNTFAVGADGQDKLVWAGSVAGGLSFILEATSYISIAKAFGSHRTVAYQLRCVKI